MIEREGAGAFPRPFLVAFWLFYAATTLSSVGYSGPSLIFPLVLWSAVAVVAGFVSVAFLLRYARQT